MRLPRLREWREARGFTQKALSEEAGVREETVTRLEGGASGSPTSARKIANALEIEVSDLLKDPPVPLVGASRSSGDVAVAGPSKLPPPRDMHEALNRAGVTDRLLDSSPLEIEAMFDEFESREAYKEAHATAIRISEAQEAVSSVLEEYEDTDEVQMLQFRALAIDTIASLCFDAILARMLARAGVNSQQVSFIDRAMEQLANIDRVIVDRVMRRLGTFPLQ